MTQVGLAQVHATQVGMTQVGSIEIGLNINMLFSPLVQRLHPLLENSKMFLICHSSPLTPHVVCSVSTLPATFLNAAKKHVIYKVAYGVYQVWGAIARRY